MTNALLIAAIVLDAVSTAALLWPTRKRRVAGAARVLGREGAAARKAAQAARYQQTHAELRAAVDAQRARG